MSASAKLLPLNDGDRQKLLDKRSTAMTLTLGPSVIALVLLGLLFIFPNIFVILTVVVFDIALLTIALTGFFGWRSLSRDLRQGQKQLLAGPVEAQDCDVTRTKDEDGVEGDARYRWWIQIRGKKITVTEDQYYRFKKGDLAQALVTPHAEVVLGLSKESDYES